MKPLLLLHPHILYMVELDGEMVKPFCWIARTLNMKINPEELTRSDAPFHYNLRVCQPETTAPKAAEWMKTGGSWYPHLARKRLRASRIYTLFGLSCQHPSGPQHIGKPFQRFIYTRLRRAETCRDLVHQRSPAQGCPEGKCDSPRETLGFSSIPWM